MRIAAALLVLLAAGCGGGATTVTTRVPGLPVGLAVDGDRVYAAIAEGATGVVALDAGSGTTRAAAATRPIPLRLAVEGRNLWVTEFGAGSVARIDARRMRVTGRVDVGAQPEGIAVAGGRVWVVLQAERELVALDPRSARVVRRVPLARALEPRLVAADGDRLWVSDYAGGQLIPVGADGSVGDPVAACAGAQAMAIGGGGLWVACTTAGEVVRVDTATRRVTARVPVAGGPDGLALHDGTVLVVNDDGPVLTAIDADDPSQTSLRRIANEGVLGDANSDVAVAGGRAWVTYFHSRRIYGVPLPSS